MSLLFSFIQIFIIQKFFFGLIDIPFILISLLLEIYSEHNDIDIFSHKREINEIYY